MQASQTGGPLKPCVGLSGEVPLLDFSLPVDLNWPLATGRIVMETAQNTRAKALYIGPVKDMSPPQRRSSGSQDEADRGDLNGLGDAPGGVLISPWFCFNLV